ncbi:MAG: hypothetical protein ACOYXA_13015 [Bacteroidota bacterium]
MKRSFFAILIALCAFPAAAQKVKYKDLYILLNARQFDQAEPFLRRYLADEKENPNAHLFMAQLLQEKSVKADVLKEADRAKVLADSAILYYDLAMKGITERELKRNGEYYEAYSRRDLRTGEFGIKMSDIHLDIEKRVQMLKERSSRITLLNRQFQQIQKLYTSVVNQFVAIQKSQPGWKEFLLRSDEQTLDALKKLRSVADSCTAAFQEYKTTLAQLGKTGYNPILTPRALTDFQAPADAPVDFSADQVAVYDFAGWATEATGLIENEVIPLRKELIARDIEINKLAEKVKKDSVSVNTEIPAMEARLRDNPVKKFDPAPMPLEVFKMKISELKYGSLRVENKAARDSADLGLKARALEAEWNAVARVDSIASLLMARPLEEEATNYAHFVTNAYGTTQVLKNLIQATQDYAANEKRRRELQLRQVKEAMKWLMIEKDSVPLVVGNTSSAYKPLVIKDDQYTLGLKFGADSSSVGYFYTITPSRKPDLKINFPLDKKIFNTRSLPVIKGLANADEQDQLYYGLVYSETKQHEKFPVCIAKIYRTDGLAWSNTYQMDYRPTELILNATTGELTVKTTDTTGESKLVIIDKSGKIVQ